MTKQPGHANWIECKGKADCSQESPGVNLSPDLLPDRLVCAAESS